MANNTNSMLILGGVDLGVTLPISVYSLEIGKEYYMNLTGIEGNSLNPDKMTHLILSYEYQGGLVTHPIKLIKNPKYTPQENGVATLRQIEELLESFGGRYERLLDALEKGSIKVTVARVKQDNGYVKVVVRLAK